MTETRRSIELTLSARRDDLSMRLLRIETTLALGPKPKHRVALEGLAAFYRDALAAVEKHEAIHGFGPAVPIPSPAIAPDIEDANASAPSRTPTVVGRRAARRLARGSRRSSRALFGA